MLAYARDTTTNQIILVLIREYILNKKKITPHLAVRRQHALLAPRHLGLHDRVDVEDESWVQAEEVSQEAFSLRRFQVYRGNKRPKFRAQRGGIRGAGGGVGRGIPGIYLGGVECTTTRH